jgi:hypothetical protein
VDWWKGGWMDAFVDGRRIDGYIHSIDEWMDG